MDISRQLKQGINTGNLLFGQRQAKGACSNGDARLILVAANCPINYISDLRTNHPTTRCCLCETVPCEYNLCHRSRTE